MSLERNSGTGAMKRVQFSVTYPDRFVHPLQQRLMETQISRAELLMWSPTDDATTLFWCDGNREATEQLVTGLDSLLVSTAVDVSDGTCVFLQQADYEFSPAILETIADAAVIFLPPVVFLETGEVQFEAAGESAALSTFYEDLSDLGVVTVEQVHAFERRSTPSALTDRQRAALEAAVSVGYYEVPRNGTVADVAAVLECSSSTAGELLRKAEAAVVTGFLERR
ncbi:HTH DNA binding domain-containing protein [Natrinema hispanicum]|uniref:HTH DNA binding domain-containing protein n=2 Tax=Natrinema hispanicum TaxID=392421 RepID=A0A1I0CGN0_9EURY|nr:helix-turn-helix domain-containing protein [Natrinema hispanicum]SDC48795.1 HTH DNA binding domain-containing protein [Natrinema hispanicum]SET18251.1 HTH DNA binding domain-containing protein [Natrinema hispanicum]